jgi:putative heme iron utilization protein
MGLRTKMTERTTCRLPQLADGGEPAQQVEAILIGQGLPAADAQRLVENELTVTPTAGLKKLSELLEGRPGEGGKWVEASEASKAAAAKLIAFLRWDGTSRPQPEALTDKEKKLVVERGLDMEVRAGFFERIADYTKSDEHVAAVLKLFSPTVDFGDRNTDMMEAIMQTTDRIREAVERNPRKMTLQLAQDLGVPEVEVIRAFPLDRVMELDVSRWEDMIRSFEVLGTVRVLVSNGATTIEVDGQFGGFSTAGDFFNVQTDSLDMHIRWRQLAAAFAVEKPGHMDGMATRSFQFFDKSGAAAFKLFLNFGGPISPQKEALFNEMRAKFKR